MTEHDQQEGASLARVKYVCSAANSSHGYSAREARRSRKRDRCTRSLPVLGSSDLLAYTVYLFRAGQRELSLDRAAGRPGHTGMHYSWAENFVLQKLIVITGKLVHWGTSFWHLSVTMPSNNKPGTVLVKRKWNAGMLSQMLKMDCLVIVWLDCSQHGLLVKMLQPGIPRLRPVFSFLFCEDYTLKTKLCSNSVKKVFL